MPGTRASGTDIGGLLYLGFVLVVMFLPPLLSRRDTPPGDSDGDSGGGGGGGSRPPERPSGKPRGGLPLPDAAPARVRLRDHQRMGDLLPTRERRPAREPRPVRVPHPSRH